MALDLFAATTVLTPPTGARVVRDITYLSNDGGALFLDAYLPAQRANPRPGVLLVNGDADEATIARAKDWGVYRSYGEHLAARGFVGIPFVHHSTERGKRSGHHGFDIVDADDTSRSIIVAALDFLERCLR